jgi:hypothetical protein
MMIGTFGTPRVNAAAVATAIALSACGETVEVTYDSYAIAVQAGAMETGWLPQWLPKNSTQILERHNIDTNARMWAAKVPVGSQVTLAEGCVSAVPDTLPAPPFQRTWWPKGVPHSLTTGHDFSYFRCGNEFVGLAVSGGILIGWSLQ